MRRALKLSAVVLLSALVTFVIVAAQSSVGTIPGVVAVRNTTESTPELGFASAVAEFGMLLRDSEHKGSSTFADVREHASRFNLIDAAEGVNRVSRGRD